MLPNWLIYCMQINAVLGSLIFYRIYTKTKIMRTKDDFRDNMFFSCCRRDAQHWNMYYIFVACITFLIPRILVLIFSIILEYICVR